MFKRLLFTLLILFLCQWAHAQTWNTGSGGNSMRNGMTNERGPATEKILWQGGSSAVIAQQAVIDGHVVAMSRIRDIADVLDGTDIVAQDIRTGDFLWTTSLPIDFPNSDWRSRVSAIRNGHVYATRSGNTNMSYLYALDTLDGSIVWRSEDLIDESSTESCAFAENGDLIVGNNRSILRIDYTNGSTIWKTPRTTPTSNGQEVAIHDGFGYYWEPSPMGPEITRIELLDGIVWGSVVTTPGLIQQLAPFVGPDGTIYAPRSMNNEITDSLIAYEYDLDFFQKKWSVPIAYIPFSTSAIAPDGAVYSYGRNDQVIRIDPEQGVITHESIPILYGASSSPRMCIDADNRVYVTNGEFDEGALYVFDRELNLLWTTLIPRVNIGGPAMGPNGTLVVCGVGTDVRAYEGLPTSTDEPTSLEVSLKPTMTRDHIIIDGSKEDLDQVSIISTTGATIWYQDHVRPGLKINTEHWTPGTYIAHFEKGDHYLNIPFVIQ